MNERLIRAEKMPERSSVLRPTPGFPIYRRLPAFFTCIPGVGVLNNTITLGNILKGGHFFCPLFLFGGHDG